MAHLKVVDLSDRYSEALEMHLLAGNGGLQRPIALAEVEKPGLSLTGYLKGFVKRRALIFGKAEMEYLHMQPIEKQRVALKKVLTAHTPFTIIAHRGADAFQIQELCAAQAVPLFYSRLPEMQLMQRLLNILTEECAATTSCHGSFVEIFGIGVLIQGDAAVGKSESALGLIKRGHRLISDDVVKFKKKDDKSLEGCGFETSRHHLELKGVGIVNIAKLYGTVAVREKKSLDIVVKLEVWDDSQPYDHGGTKEKTIPLLGVQIPFHILYVKPGRDIVLFLETIALNHRLKHLSAQGTAWQSSN